MRSSFVALGLAVSLVAGAEPAKKKDKPKPPPKEEHETGRTKRSEAVDYDPDSAPTRKVGKKVIQLAEITVEGVIEKPLVYIDVVPPAGAEPLARTLPVDLVAAVDAIDAVDAAARVRRGAGTKWSAAARETVDAATAVLAASGPAALASATGDDRRALAYLLLRATPSLAAASALLCPAGQDLAAAKRAADLDACTGTGVDPARAAYAWLEVGRALGPSNAELAERAYSRAGTAPAVAAIAAYEHAVALYRVDRTIDAARAFDEARVLAAGDGLIAENALQWIAIAIGSDDASARAGDTFDPKALLAQIDALYAGRARDPARVEVIARLSALRFDMTDYDAAIALARAALQAAPLAPDAPRWHAIVVRALSQLRKLPEAKAEQGQLDRAYADGTEWWAANKANPAAMRALTDAKAPASELSSGGTIPQAVVRAALEAHRAELRRCAVGSLAVAATLHLEVSPDGGVKGASVTGAPPDVAACMSALAIKWSLPPPEGDLRTLDLPIRIAR